MLWYVFEVNMSTSRFVVAESACAVDPLTVERVMK